MRNSSTVNHFNILGLLTEAQKIKNWSEYHQSWAFSNKQTLVYQDENGLIAHIQKGIMI